MKIDIVTIFPEYFAPLELSLLGKARAAGLLDIAVHDLRRWTYDVHRTVDDSPYGGGAGMVMRPEPWGDALDVLAPIESHTRLIVPSAAGEPFSHAIAADLATEAHLIFAAGRYEGIDQRVVDHAATRLRVTEVSIGDYVLFGGEVAALVMIEALARLIPGVLGNAASLDDESHTDGLLESPVYTKPPEWRGFAVPEVLRSGDHGRIARWRRDQALLCTAERRPDLLRALDVGELDRRDLDVLTGIGFDVRRDAAAADAVAADAAAADARRADAGAADAGTAEAMGAHGGETMP
jgi:tRNA (guanine37-N1)-methyltransferase